MASISDEKREKLSRQAKERWAERKAAEAAQAIGAPEVVSADATTESSARLPAETPVEEAEVSAEAAPTDTNATEGYVSLKNRNFVLATVEGQEVKIATSLSENDKQKLINQAKEQVQEEIRQKEKDTFRERMVEEMRAQAGIGSTAVGGVEDEIVELLIDLGDELDGKAEHYIDIDMASNKNKRFYHNQRAKMPRHVARGVMYTMFRLKLNALVNMGKSAYTQRQKQGFIVGEHGVRKTGLSMDELMQGRLN